MLSRYLAMVSLAIAFLCAYSAYSHRSALVLREEATMGRGTRFGASPSGRYVGGIWVSSPSRSTYGSFRGGGPGAGK